MHDGTAAQPSTEPTQAAYSGMDQQADYRERRTKETLTCLKGLDRFRTGVALTTVPPGGHGDFAFVFPLSRSRHQPTNNR